MPLTRAYETQIIHTKANNVTNIKRLQPKSIQSQIKKHKLSRGYNIVIQLLIKP